jgi:hypothetical protein
MASSRRLTPNTIGQGKNEEIAYKVDFTKWCRTANPVSACAVQLINVVTGLDVTATNCTGAPTNLGNVVTTPSVHDLSPDTQYRMNVQATIDGNILEAWVIIVGEE